ncbi:MAG: DUF488 family protein [Salana multivorans]|uniref:DUF488 domain-containing protein n=1 Tax=Salana multivorans TaxID=120377 RepID=UPI000B18C158|nr:DUF488 family protein [Salana multivorans]MBN8883485.1 DUF488 family protein [Salana multivorans]
MGEIRLERIYAPAGPDDGYRILVDRLWPRGISHERAALDLWLKDVAPSSDLRERWHHDPATWPTFVSEYEAELGDDDHRGALATLRSAAVDHPVVTLLYAARDTEHNEAVVLRSVVLDEPVPGVS